MSGLTPELAAKRLGKMTASFAPVVMGKLNTDGLSKLVRRLAGERMHGDLGEESYSSWQMDRGNAVEEAAMRFAEFELDTPLLRQQHIDHPTIPNVAATPDGYAPVLLTAEVKCPTWHVFCETVEAWKNGRRGIDAVPSEYRWQCRWQVWCAQVPEGRFIAFHPAGGGQGIIVPYTVPQSDFDAMAERVVKVEALIRKWIEILRG